MAANNKRQLNVAMFPFFAIGHISAYLHLSNRLAARGHRVAFLLPRGARDRVAHLNEHPDLIVFHPLTVPQVEGLPPGAETAADVPAHLVSRIPVAMDAVEDQFRRILGPVAVDYVFYDTTPWVPRVGRELGFKSVAYGCTATVETALRLVPSTRIVEGMTDEEMLRTPPGYPSTTVVPRRRPYEIEKARFYARDFGSVSFYDRMMAVISGADVTAVRTCREVEGKYCDYLEEQYGKPMLLTGPAFPKRHGLGLDEKWASWLAKFPLGSVVFCALGSETVLSKDQFQEYLRGFELCGRPFLAALRPPEGCTTVEEAIPEGYEERVVDGGRGRGMVYGGWVPQLDILDHPSVGCFVSHGGYSSMWEALLSDCQIVFIPNSTEHIAITMLNVHELKVAVEVEKDFEKGWISKEKLSGAIETVMDRESEVGKEVRRNHLELREALSYERREKYVDEFVSSLIDLLKES